MKITHYKHHEINLQKWDACIQNASNSLVYAESWYLDIVSPNWEALILDDYEYVMPLPVKKKYGFSFLVQPPLTQQLGVFSKHIIEENIIEHFFKKIPYRSYHLNLNEQNIYHKGVKLPNYVLNLNRDYNTIFSAYSTNTKRNIKKFKSFNLYIKKDLSANEFLEFYHSVEKNYPTESETKINKLIEESYRRKRITLFGAYNLNNELISALVLLHSSQRIIYLLPVSNKEGKDSLAMFGIVDTIIQNYANNDLIFDFEGSKIKGVASFYEGFGAGILLYFMIKHRSVNDCMNCFCFWR
ncbi:MAG: hypothetical protein FWH59_01335 [Lentimicrobiaceae bacterium]|nr:hypothetical protein [Lentimicrobiaceae bacterium]